MFLLNHCADPYGPKTVRAAMGASFRLPAWEVELKELQTLACRADIPIYAAALDDRARAVGKIDLSRCAVVIGNEGRGVSQAVLAAAAGTVMIPMRDRCESLNAAAAAAVVLWEMGQARG